MLPSFCRWQASHVNGTTRLESSCSVGGFVSDVVFWPSRSAGLTRNSDESAIRDGRREPTDTQGPGRARRRGRGVLECVDAIVVP